MSRCDAERGAAEERGELRDVADDEAAALAEARTTICASGFLAVAAATTGSRPRRRVRRRGRRSGRRASTWRPNRRRRRITTRTPGWGARTEAHQASRRRRREDGRGGPRGNEAAAEMSSAACWTTWGRVTGMRRE